MAGRGVNKVILVGNLGNDPEVRFAPNGSAIANLSLATSDSWIDKNTGQRQERTEWHRVVIFGKLAEIAQQYLRKGSKVYIEGKLQTRKWQDQSGQDKYTTEIVVDGFGGQMQMLDSQNQGQGNGYNDSGYQHNSRPPAQQQPPQQNYQQPQQSYNQAPAAPAYNQQPAPQQSFQQPAPTQPIAAPQSYQQPQQAPQKPAAAPQPAAGGFDDFDDDIPF